MNIEKTILELERIDRQVNPKIPQDYGIMLSADRDMTQAISKGVFVLMTSRKFAVTPSNWSGIIAELIKLLSWVKDNVKKKDYNSPKKRNFVTWFKLGWKVFNFILNIISISK